MLKFELNVPERKTLAVRLEALTGVHRYYTKAPLYAYEIGNYTIDREGNLLVEQENADQEILNALLQEELIRAGHDNHESDNEMAEEVPMTESSGQETEQAEACGESESEKTENEADSMRINIALPVEGHTGVSLRNLVNLIYSRGTLISKATGGRFRVDEELIETLKDDACARTVEDFIETLEDYRQQYGEGLEGLLITKDAVTFQGFPAPEDADHLQAYTRLAAQMNTQALRQQRIQAKPINEENEKYALRIWLIRLGMNGDDFKQTRKILLENLDGNAAFRTPEEAELAKEKAQQKRDALRAEKEARK